MLSAQTYKQKAATFKDSYNNEYKQEYNMSISALRGMYDENSYPINLRLGWLHYLKGDYLKSQEFYQKAMDLQPGAVEAKMGYVYPLSALGEWQEVADMYEKILVLAPNNTLVNYNLAYIYFNNFKKNNDALKHASIVVKLYPFDYDGNMLMGRILLSLGKLKEAKSLF